MKQILIVDDNHDMNFLISLLLQGNGYHVHSEYNGKSALAYLQKESIDLILLDIKLQKMTGFEVINEIKKMKLTIPIILITSYGDLRTKSLAYQSGAADFIIKPFVNKELLGKVQAILN